MNTAHIHLRDATIRAVDYVPAVDHSSARPYLAVRFAEGAAIYVREEDIVGSRPERTTHYYTPAQARALASLILKALPTEDESEECPECGGCGVVERSIPNGPNYVMDAEMVCECQEVRR